MRHQSLRHENLAQRCMFLILPRIPLRERARKSRHINVQKSCLIREISQHMERSDLRRLNHTIKKRRQAWLKTQ
jgi:hypothetical protein